MAPRSHLVTQPLENIVGVMASGDQKLGLYPEYGIHGCMFISHSLCVLVADIKYISISPVTANLQEYTADLGSYHGYWQQNLYELNEKFWD